MQLPFQPARLTGFAILAVAAATALSVGACTSHHAKSPETSSPASANDEAQVGGQIASAAGDVVQLTQENGKATVHVSPSAKIIEFSVSHLSDIAPGSCVNVTATPAPNPGGAVTATNVQWGPPGPDSECADTKNAQPPNVLGTLASVAGNTINVNVTDGLGNPSESHVTVADTTQYVKRAPVTSQAIQPGKCLTTVAIKDGEATVIGLGPVNDGKCPQPAH
ncbi:hypothetical protein [Mycobacterium sp.]|uniref:hypothetical protein n=1 Tax=Mycobacterium sp. TaxID=1785 RepID=UPI003BB19071